MTAPKMSDPNAPNLILMLTEWLPPAIKSAKDTITRLEAQLVKVRAELGVLERHAAVAGIAVDEPAPPVEDAP